MLCAFYAPLKYIKIRSLIIIRCCISINDTLIQYRFPDQRLASYKAFPELMSIGYGKKHNQRFTRFDGSSSRNTTVLAI